MYYEQFITQEGVKATGRSRMEGGKRPLEKRLLQLHQFVSEG